jgi:hypothetical protein
MFWCVGITTTRGKLPGAEGRGSLVSFRVAGSARDYLDITDSKGLHWGLDLGCVADQDGD